VVMEEYDIAVIKVAYEGGDGAKLRPAFVIKLNGDAVEFYKITSQYWNKSDWIKTRYFEIIDYTEAGLRKPSWIDTVRREYCEKKATKIKTIGQLSDRDLKRFKRFLGGAIE